MEIKNVKWSHYTINNENQFVCLRLESRRRMRYIFFQVHLGNIYFGRYGDFTRTISLLRRYQHGFYKTFIYH